MKLKHAVMLAALLAGSCTTLGPAVTMLNEKVGKLEFEKYLGETPELNGKVILLEFWATWCPPCRKVIPHMNALHNKFKDKGLVVICVSNEDERAVQAYLDIGRPAIDYYVAISGGEQLLDKFKVREIPAAFLIDRNGVVVWEGEPQQLDDATVEKALGK